MTDQVRNHPAGKGRARLVVGVLSFRESPYIGEVAVQADRGLSTFFRDSSRAIFHCDLRTDTTRGNDFFDVPTEAAKFHVRPRPEPGGERGAILSFLRRALELDAEAVILLESDIRNVTPEWIRHMFDPLLQGFDLVMPVHPRTRQVDDLTDHIVYPLMRALYGKRVRQPIGHAFGLSTQLAEIMLRESQKIPFRRSGLGIQLTTYAIVHGLKVCQSFFEEPIIHRQTSVSDDLFPEFSDTMETLFILMGRFHRVWKNVRWSKPVVTLNAKACPRGFAVPVDSDQGHLYRRFRDGLRAHADFLDKVLRPDTVKKLNELEESPAETFEFPGTLWALALFDFSLAYKKRTAELAPLMDALMPIFFGMVYSSCLSTAQMGPRQREVYVDHVCQAIEETKPYLEFLWQKH